MPPHVITHSIDAVARLWVLVASLALVGAACGGSTPTDDARASSRSASTAPAGTVAPPASTTGPSPTSTPPAPTASTPATPTAPLPQTTAVTPPPPAPAPAPASPPANGRLPDASLTTVTPSCRIPSDLAPRLRSLLDAAHAVGIALWPETQPFTTGPTPPRLTSCYRDIEMQQWWRDYYCGQGSCGMAAVPGTSVHGWGRAVDFEEAGQELAFDMAGYRWLVEHASTFGFTQPGWAGPSGSAPEPWHWEAT